VQTSEERWLNANEGGGWEEKADVRDFGINHGGICELGGAGEEFVIPT